MQTTSNISFNDLVEKYLGKRLPKDLADPVSMSAQPSKAKEFIEQVLRLMEQSGYPATSITPFFIRWLSTIKTMLPCAWGGQIPPITMPNRHGKLDAYIKAQDRFNGTKAPVFLDMGCGFPPITTSDTAKALPDWQVFGVDYSFPDYIVYNEEGHYACFTENGDFQYFQALMSLSGRAMYQDPEGTKKHFTDLFSTLKEQGSAPNENGNGNTSKTLEMDGARLIHNHVLNFETDNLNLIKSNISDVKLPPVKVIRCMNVHVYFDPDTRKKMLVQAGELLDDDGLMIVGTNGLSIQSRYFVYEKKAVDLMCREFAFSPDNLGPISFMPWYALHDNDPETMLLSRLSGTIRSDDRFWSDFSNAMDKLLEENHICRRGPDDFFQVPKEEMLPEEYMAKTVSIWQELSSKGYVAGAVEVLKKAGYTAWENAVGDIAILPPSDSI